MLTLSGTGNIEARRETGIGVLFLVNSLNRGGSERKTIQLANGLLSRGHRPAIACLRDGDSMKRFLSEGIPVVDLKRTGHFSPRVMLKIRRSIADLGIDLIVAVNHYPAVYAVLAKALRPTANLKLMASINSSPDLSSADRRWLPIYRWALRRCDLVAFGAVAQQRLWEHEFNCVLEDRQAAVLYNGVDTSRFSFGAVHPARFVGWPASRKSIGIVAALRPEKAHIHLVDALAIVRQRGLDAGLVIVGDGPCRAQIQGRVKTAGLENELMMTGDVDDVRPYLAAFDVFALPSIAETFSNAALEAMAMGCPVVASAMGGMPEMLRHGGGTLFQPGDVNSLADGLFDVLISEDRRRELGQAARRAAVAHFSIDRMMDDFLAMAHGSLVGSEGQRV